MSVSEADGVVDCVSEGSVVGVLVSVAGSVAGGVGVHVDVLVHVGEG